MERSEQYRLYLLNITAEVMSDEIHELMRYGISPLGVGKARPLNKERQKALRPLLEQINDSIRQAATNMIEKAVTLDDEATAEEWIELMLAELENRSASVGGESAQELDNVKKSINQIRQILNGAIDCHG